MRRVEKRFGLILLLAMIVSFCGMDIMANPNSSIKRKEISRSFSVNGNDRLEVENKYGNITVTHWNKGEVSIKVVIECKASNDRLAEEGIERVMIESKNEGGIISANTRFRNSNGGSRNESLTVNYFIQMPAKLKAGLNQKYGNINLPENGNNEMKIVLKYGNLNAGSFIAPLSVEAKYSNVKLGEIMDADLDLGYAGSVDILKAKRLNVDSKYSNMSVKELESMAIECKYGKVNISNANVLDMNLAYSDVKIDRLEEGIDVERLSYSNIDIKHLSPSFKRFDVKSNYGNVKVKLPASSSFRVVAENMKYSDCNIKGFKMNMNDFSKSDKKYTFEINNGNGPTIYFDGNSYGNLNVIAE